MLSVAQENASRHAIAQPLTKKRRRETAVLSRNQYTNLVISIITASLSFNILAVVLYLLGVYFDE